MPTAVAACIVSVLVGAGIGALVVYVVTTHELGPAAAGRVVWGPLGWCLGGIIATVLILLLASLFVDFRVLLLLTYFFCIGVCAAGAVYWWQQCRLLGAPLAELGRSGRQNLAVVGIGLILLTQLPAAFSNYRTEPIALTGVRALFFAGWIGSVSLSAFTRRQVREGGILDVTGPVRWDQIQRYGWSGETGSSLTLWTNRNRFFTWRVLSLRIPEEHVYTVDRLLRERAYNAIRVLPEPKLQEQLAL